MTPLLLRSWLATLRETEGDITGAKMDRRQLNVSPNEKEKSLDSPVMQTVEEHIDFDEDIVLPTEEEKRTLRRVAGHIPMSAWLVVVVEFAERFSYYGTTGPFVNYIQRPLPEGGNGAGAPPKGTEIRPGALGKGQQASTGVGHVILVGTAAPALLQNNPTGSYVGLIISLIIMGFATGAIKSNVSPLVAEQIPNSREHIRVMKNGERVIVDPNLTIQRMINIGSLGSIATTETELHSGFCLTFCLQPTIVYVLVPIVLWVGRHKYVQYPPRGSIHIEAFRVIRRVYKGVWSLNPSETFRRMRDPSKWDRARPGHAAQAHGNSNVTGEFTPTWDDTFVDEMRRTMHAVKIFVFYPLAELRLDNQMTNNIVSQAGVMTTHGVPNDLLQNINAIPHRYPGLRRIGCIVRPIQRITLGFMFAAMAMVYASALQNGIYKTNPCGRFVTDCETRSSLNVWIQTPAYVLISCSEIITGLEYAYNKAPLRMKSIVMAAFLLTQGVGNALSWALLPVSTDPYLVWNVSYAGSGIAAIGRQVPGGGRITKGGDIEKPSNSQT
ncbi:MFS peptide transporter, putative [Rhizoctonia solani AG-1 IA]|uniref:MFS peptide transporter, putative n=1 Tax=Thanatephorus cucumeris (strain AG1-IA) TaxID=983506 RepID=L8WIQ4_THACA|nr:MFS peptide transporter, putative [Rhizoctonia solani AG-1 IA]